MKTNDHRLFAHAKFLDKHMLIHLGSRVASNSKYSSLMVIAINPKSES